MEGPLIFSMYFLIEHFHFILTLKNAIYGSVKGFVAKERFNFDFITTTFFADHCVVFWWMEKWCGFMLGNIPYVENVVLTSQGNNWMVAFDVSIT